jgi:hypothetical protein
MNDVNFNFGINDRASGTLKKIKREADGAQNSMSRAAKAMSLGGEAFSKYGERFNKFSQLSGVFGALGIAAIGAGIAFTAMTNANNRAIESAKTQVEWQQRLRDEIKATGDAALQFKAGGVNQADALGQLIGRGGNPAMVANAVSQGIDQTDATKGESALLLIRNAKQREAVRRAALDVARLHESSYSEAVDKISQLRGPISSERGLLAVTGQRTNAETMTFAKNRLGLLNDPSGQIAQVNAAVSANGQPRMDQAGYLLSGETAAAITQTNQENRAKTTDPRGEAVKKIREAADKLQESLQATQKAQSTYFASFQDGLEAIYLGAGSESTKLANHRRDTAVIRD